MRLKYAVLFEQAENNWAAYVPDLPGCMTTGKTLEQTEINIREAFSCGQSPAAERRRACPTVPSSSQTPGPRFKLYRPDSSV
jgi:predicted RNase H-like HicB family nuclease